MGYTRWDDKTWDTYSTSSRAKSTSENFTSSEMHSELDPKNTTRESRDSDLNPNSTPIMIGCDVTASMGMIADSMIKEGLGVVFQEIIDRAPVPDPHVLIGGIGDVACDRAPLQVSQFETDLSIAKHLERVYLEHGGGGNSTESYDLFVYYAAFHTSTDCFDKRGKRGYLFTIGDENPAKFVSSRAVTEFLGGGLQHDMPFDDCVEVVSRMYNYYHIIIKEGSHFRFNGFESVRDNWRTLIGQNAIVLDDYTNLAEVIVSIIEINEGKDNVVVADSWNGNTALVVANATKHINTTTHNKSKSIRL